MEILIFWDVSAPGGHEQALSRHLSRLFSSRVPIRENPVVLTGYSGHRHQYDAVRILDTLERHRRRSHITSPILLITGHDLFHNRSEAVYGLARPENKVAVVSTTRLANRYYGLDDDDKDLDCRLLTEAAHEIGHLEGLSHCKDPSCIMFSPSTLAELSGKKPEFCQGCRDILQAISGPRLDEIAG